MSMYRLSWEMVGVGSLGKYSNAEPTFYKNTTQVVPNSLIPDEDWHSVSKETGDPWTQYRNLKAWADADTGFVRNVRVEEQVSQPTWREVIEPPQTDGDPR